MLEKKEFVNYNLDENKKKAPIPVKLNDKNEEMLTIGMYAFNMHSKSGVLKELAELGLKVLLDQIGVEKMHKLTRGDRTRVIQEKPKYEFFPEKV